MIKNQKKLKLGLDMIMISTLLALMVPTILSQEIHEWTGLIIGAAIILHLAMNWRWIKNVSKNLIKISGRAKVMYMLNILLLLGFTFIILSGIYMSETINFSWLGLGYNHNNVSWKIIHTTMAYLTLIVAGIHLGLNFSWVINSLRNQPRSAGKTQLGTIKPLINTVVLILILAGGIYSFSYLDYASKANPAALITALEQWGEPDGLGRGGGGSEDRVNNGEGFRGGRASSPGDSSTLPVGFPDRGQRGAGDGLHGQSGETIYLLLAFAGVYALIVTGTYFIDRKLNGRSKTIT